MEDVSLRPAPIRIFSPEGQEPASHHVHEDTLVPKREKRETERERKERVRQRRGWEGSVRRRIGSVRGEKQKEMAEK